MKRGRRGFFRIPGMDEGATACSWPCLMMTRSQSPWLTPSQLKSSNRHSPNRRRRGIVGLSAPGAGHSRWDPFRTNFGMLLFGPVAASVACPSSDPLSARSRRATARRAQGLTLGSCEARALCRINARPSALVERTNTPRVSTDPPIAVGSLGDSSSISPHKVVPVPSHFPLTLA